MAKSDKNVKIVKKVFIFSTTETIAQSNPNFIPAKVSQNRSILKWY